MDVNITTHFTQMSLLKDVINTDGFEIQKNVNNYTNRFSIELWKT